MNVHLYFYPRPWQTLGIGFAYLSFRLENKSYMQLSMVGNFEGPSWGGECSPNSCLWTVVQGT